MPEFKEGDIVQLKSGGPKMTVRSISDTSGEVYCQWFSGSKMQSGGFKPSSLIKEEETDE